MLKESFKYKQYIIEKHVGGARPLYVAFLDGVKVLADYNLAWLKKDLRLKEVIPTVSEGYSQETC